jgi:Ubiquitin carboxyl-terminal hydrolase
VGVERVTRCQSLKKHFSFVNTTVILSILTKIAMNPLFQATRDAFFRRYRLHWVLGSLTAWSAVTYGSGAHTSSLAMATTSGAPPISDVRRSTGLKNLGNTCYMNAQLECAYHIPLVWHIATQSAKRVQQSSSDATGGNPSSAAIALGELFDAMDKAAQDRSPAHAPQSFCVRLGISPNVQQDSQEFWKLLLPAVGSERLSDLYKGTFVDYILALDGSGIERRRDELFLDLSVEVTKR